MRAVSHLAPLCLMAFAAGCGGGGSGSGSPTPRGLRVHLRFARDPGRLRYQVHRKSQQLIYGFMNVWSERTLFVTEVFEDSLEAHLVHVRIDSGGGGAKPQITPGPFLGFMGWFNDRRERLDTLATDPGVEDYRAVVFDGSVPLPDDSVGVGESWVTGPRPHVSEFQLPESPLHATVRGVVKDLRVAAGDTIASLAFDLDVKGRFKPERANHEVDVHGVEKGEETFSVHRGITLTLALKGQIEWDTDLMGPGGLQRVYTILHSQSERTLIQ